MWLNNILSSTKTESNLPLFDEALLRRLERLNFRTAPTLRGGLGGERRSRNLRPALDFSDHRPYTHGDDLRHVDWSVYSRTEELFVKLGESPQSVNVHILLDCSRSMIWSPSQDVETVEKEIDNPRSLKWDSARRLAGAMAYLGLSGGERIEITPFADTLGEGFGPTQGKRQAIPMLKYLASITPIPPAAKPKTESGLVHSLANYARRHPYGGLMILISDLLDTAAPSDESTEDWEELAEGLRYFPTPRWQILVMHLLAEPEMHPTLQGDFDLQDLETGESLPFHLDDSTLSQYRLRVRRWCAELKTACASRAATYARIMAEWPFEKSVVPYLRQRGAIQ